MGQAWEEKRFCIEKTSSLLTQLLKPFPSASCQQPCCLVSCTPSESLIKLLEFIRARLTSRWAPAWSQSQELFSCLVKNKQSLSHQFVMLKRSHKLPRLALIALLWACAWSFVKQSATQQSRKRKESTKTLSKEIIFHSLTEFSDMLMLQNVHSYALHSPLWSIYDLLYSWVAQGEG